MYNNLIPYNILEISNSSVVLTSHLLAIGQQKSLKQVSKEIQASVVFIWVNLEQSDRPLWPVLEERGLKRDLRESCSLVSRRIWRLPPWEPLGVLGAALMLSSASVEDTASVPSERSKNWLTPRALSFQSSQISNDLLGSPSSLTFFCFMLTPVGRQFVQPTSPANPDHMQAKKYCNLGSAPSPSSHAYQQEPWPSRGVYIRKANSQEVKVTFPDQTDNTAC